jgi:hypothetical protein
MMINTIYGESPTSNPCYAIILCYRDIHEKDMSSCHLCVAGPSIRLAGRDGEHIDGAQVLQSRMGNVGREPAVNTVAMEEDGMIDRSRHLGNLG